MALAAVVAGQRAVVTDVNQFYNLLKGVTGSGEAITLIYNAAASLIFQPSSDPAAGTEVVQIKNNAGTVQGSLTYDGKVKTSDGTAALPSHRFQSEASGFYLSSAGVIGVSVSGAAANILMRSGAISVGATPAASGAIRIPYQSIIRSRDSTNAADLDLIQNATGDVVTVGNASYTVAIPGTALSVGTTPSTTGTLRVPNLGVMRARNFNNNNNINLIFADGSDNVAVGDAGSPLQLTSSAGNVDFRYAVTALGAGGAATLGLTGGSGPATTTQNSWLKVSINGTASFIPVWR